MVTFLRFGTWPIIWLTTIVAITAATDGFWLWLWREFAAAPFAGLGLTVLLYVTWRMARKYFRYWYALHNAKTLISMKVLIPRQETKIDQEKRTE